MVHHRNPRRGGVVQRGAQNDQFDTPNPNTYLSKNKGKNSTI